MVEFGKKLLTSQVDEWKEYYIDYDALKTRIKKAVKAKHQQLLEKNIAVNDTVFDGYLDMLEFRRMLDHEIQKIVLFLLIREGQLAERLSHMSKDGQTLKKKIVFLMRDFGMVAEEDKTNAWTHLKSSTDQHRAFAQDLLEFVNFLDMNLTGLRKILKKHDKNFPRNKLSGLYLHPTSVPSSYGSLNVSIEGDMASTQHSGTIYADHASQQMRKHEHMLILNSANRPSHLLPTTITCQREPVLDQINAARSRLRQTSEYAELVAAQSLIFFDDKDQYGSDDDKTPASEFTAVQKLSSMLNLVSTFLYMTNYYIVAPSVGNYALRLGSDESMSGYIIGMTPNAALIATVLYGFWSNYSYKKPLIFAAVSSFCGNIFYALALRYSSINMVLIGRFLVGFGSARSINRRYIADVFSKADRTAASADFVTYAALGMAAGPAAAAGVGHLHFDASNLLWSDVNASSWIMVVVWGAFVVSLVAFFEEPDRSHLYVKPKTDSSLNGKGETKPLVSGSDGDMEKSAIATTSKLENTSNEPPLWKNVAVMVSLWLYFVLKLVLEMLMSSSGTVTKYYFSWDSKQSGLFLACVALLMFPVNFAVAKLSQKFEDRELIIAALIVMVISVLGMIDYDPDSYSVYQYVTFGVGIFLSTNGLEGVNMSLLSKTIPTSWAKGTFNSGFLATEAGTLARSTGDVLISAVARLFGMGMILNGLFAPMAFLCTISLLVAYYSYDKLTDMDDDDDDETLSIDDSNKSANN
eukprot:jgi/Psemu1/240912/estExt_Genewise1.C_2010016